LQVLGWPLYELDGYEADDILGTLAHQAKALNLQTKLITSDLDMLQLIHDGNTEILNIKKGFSDIQKFDQKAFQDKYNIQVEQFVDYKALTGDSSDNIPGVAGIGPKAAQELLSKYQTLDEVYQNLWQVPTKYQNKLEAGKNSAFMSQNLATIMLDAPLKLKAELKNMHGVPKDATKLLQTLEELEFRTLIKNLPKFLKDRGASSEAEVIENSSSNQKLNTKLKLIKSPSELQNIKLNKQEPIFLYCTSAGRFGKDPLRLYLSQNIKEVFVLDLVEFAASASIPLPSRERLGEGALNSNKPSLNPSPSAGSGQALQGREIDPSDEVDASSTQGGDELNTSLTKLLGESKLVTYDSKKLLHLFAELKLNDLAAKPVAHDLQIAAFLLNSLSRASTLTDLANQELHLKLKLKVVFVTAKKWSIAHFL
jgi:hypothetical protein